MRAALSNDYQIDVTIIPHPGDAWTRLAKRVTGDAKNWWAIADFNDAGENLMAGVPVRVPFEMLRPELQRQIATSLLPEGSELETEWKKANPALASRILSPSSATPTPRPENKPASASESKSKTSPTLSAAEIDPQMYAYLTSDHQIKVMISTSKGDSWTNLALRFTGDAANWRELATVNGSTEKLNAEARIRMPFNMLRPELRDEITKALIPPGSALERDWKRVTLARASAATTGSH